MKKTIRLTEAQLVKLVKRIINEDVTKNPRFKKIIFDTLNKLVKDGLYLEYSDDGDFILFRSNEDDYIVFRYDIQMGVLRYSDDILDSPFSMFGDETWDLIPNLYEVLIEFVSEWVNLNLVPKFKDEIEEMTDDEFVINDIFNDEGFNPRTGEYEDDDDYVYPDNDEEDYEN